LELEHILTVRAACYAPDKFEILIRPFRCEAERLGLKRV
jgi:hypothetical protein